MMHLPYAWVRAGGVKSQQGSGVRMVARSRNWASICLELEVRDGVGRSTRS